MRARSLVRFTLFGLILMVPPAWGAAKKRSSGDEPVNGKKVIELREVQKVSIEMPDGTFHPFGEDFESQLATRLAKSERFLVTMPDPFPLLKSQGQAREQVKTGNPNYFWDGSVTPAASVRVEVRALTFLAGSRGDRMFYGFDEHFTTPFNAADTSNTKNEFPLRPNSLEASWFGSSFGNQGNAPFDRRSGLDLGDGFSLNFLFAWLTVKYAEYHSELRLRIHLSFPVELSGGSNSSEFHDIAVQGKGFFFDASGAYQGYSVGIMAARKDAMVQVVNRSIDSSLNTVERILGKTPLVARVDGLTSDGTVLLGTGPDSKIPVGILYAVSDHPEVVVQVVASGASGSEGRVVAGDLRSVVLGSFVRQVDSIPTPKPPQARTFALSRDASEPASVSAVRLPSQNLSKANLPSIDQAGQWQPILTEAQAFTKSLTDFVFLAYRVYRYFAYDQKYHRTPDLGPTTLAGNSDRWRRQMGLDQVPPMKPGTPVVAVIDTGVDYNHPLLHSALWLNPSPWSFDQTDRDRYGWDFISNDSHPYDDHAHGTQLASLVVNVSPSVKIMPLKAFNPWGVTTSASLYAAFKYAVDHGAHVILCGWSTSVNSQALIQGLEYARRNGVAVVASAGDGGWDLTHVFSLPSAQSGQMEQLLVVAGVDSKDRIVQSGSKSSNYGKFDVQLAAPGQNLPVAEPRGGVSTETSADLAAALVAGALSRVAVDQEFQGGGASWVQTLLQDAEVVPQLMNQVRGGLRVRVRR